MKNTLALALIFLGTYSVQLSADIHVENKTPWPIKFEAFWTGGDNTKDPLYVGPGESAWLYSGNGWLVKWGYNVHALVYNRYGDIMKWKTVSDAFNPWVDVTPTVLPNGEMSLDIYTTNK